jgi:hypothetical protein
MSNLIKNKRIFTDISGGINSVIGGTNIYIDNTDPSNPVINSNADDIIVVVDYNSLPIASTVNNKFYWVSNSIGIKWLPGSLGGTYYPKGLYYSNGVSWEYMETPYQATQAEVNTGTNTDKFVTPSTLTNATVITNKELLSNKSTDVSTDQASNTKYPSVKAVYDYLNSFPKIILKSITDVSHTGDTNVTQVYSDLIIAATFSVSSVLNLYAQFRKVGTAGNLAVRLYVNTSNTLVGATQIAQYNSGIAANLYYGVARMGLIKSATNTEIYNTTASIISSVINSSTAVSSLNIDWTVDQYFLISIQLTNTTDTGTLSGLFLERK